MNEAIDTLSNSLLVTLAVFGLVSCAAVIYCTYLLLQIRGWVKNIRQGPEVARDGQGKPIRERS